MTNLRIIISKEYDRIIHAFIGCGIAIILSYLPSVYYSAISPQYYISATNAVVDKKVYSPCDRMLITFTIDSRITTEASEVINTYIIDYQGKDRQVSTFHKEAIIEQGRQERTVLWQIPCDTPDGRYYQIALLTYEINGIKKSLTVRTNEYIVQ